jgi:hypothetical protein
MPRPLVRVALAVTLGAVSAATGLAPASAAAAREVKASAKFTVELGDHSGSYDFGQSRITESQLDWTPQVPVSLHAGRRSGPFQEFALSGRVKKGSQRTSEAVALLLSVEVKSRIAGSFTCDTTYGEQPLKAKGTFKAR